MAFSLKNFSKSKASSNSSSSWLSTLPNKSNGSYIPSTSFRLALSHRLHLDIYSTNSRCPDCDGSTSDVKGIHDTICKGKGKVVRRHDKVCETLKDICAQAHIVCTREDSDLLADGSRARPGDLVLYNWEYGQDACVDVSIVSPLTDPHATIVDPLSAVNKMANVKIQKYHNRCAAANKRFIPFIMDTFGGFHPTALDLINRIALPLAVSLRCTASYARYLIRSRLQLAAQKMLAEGLEHRRWRENSLNTTCF